MPQSAHINRRCSDHCDLPSLGATLYYALTGQTPPSATDRMAYPQSFRAPHQLNECISRQMDTVIQRAMALPCDQRWPSAAAMKEALVEPHAPTKILSSRPSALPSRPAERSTSWWRRVPVWGWALASVLLVAGLTAGFGFLGGEDRPTAMEAPTPEPTSTATPRFALHDTWTRPADGMTMVYVPGGTFQMGSNSDEHPVTLDSFWIDQTEVTNAQYKLCVTNGDCQASGYADDTDFNGYDYPVVGVSWHDAVAYCEWAGGRLPTEAEWEYAARGEQGHVYPWGDEEPTCDLAQRAGCSRQTVPVGSFPAGASWCDALDMAGNVWEWTLSLYKDYPYDSGDGREDLEASGYRVLRGGSWNNSGWGVRATIRHWYLPTDTRRYVGFRCVAVTPQEP